MVLDEPEGAEDAAATDLGEDGRVERRLREGEDEVGFLGLDRGENTGAEETHVGLLDGDFGGAFCRKAAERFHAFGERREVEDADRVAELAEGAGAVGGHRVGAAGERRDDEDAEPDVAERGAAGDGFADVPEGGTAQHGGRVREDDRPTRVVRVYGHPFEERPQVARGERRPPERAVGLDDDDRVFADGCERFPFSRRTSGCAGLLREAASLF